MNIALWVIQAILAIKLVSTAFSHGLQRSQTEMQQATEKMGKTSRLWHTLIAILAFVFAVGLILPGWLGVYPADSSPPAARAGDYGHRARDHRLGG